MICLLLLLVHLYTIYPIKKKDSETRKTFPCFSLSTPTGFIHAMVFTVVHRINRVASFLSWKTVEKSFSDQSKDNRFFTLALIIFVFDEDSSAEREILIVKNISS